MFKKKNKTKKTEEPLLALHLMSLKFVIHVTVRSDDDEKDQITPRYGVVMIL